MPESESEAVRQVVVVVEGGIVTRVYCDPGTLVEVRDYDVEPTDHGATLFTDDRPAFQSFYENEIGEGFIDTLPKPICEAVCHAERGWEPKQ